MKLTKSLISLVTLTVMLLTLVVSPLAASQTATVEMEVVSEETLSNNTKFTTYNMTGSVCEDTAKTYVFEFNPADGNIPLAFTGKAGGVTTMKNHMEIAASEGYEVVGAINGSFFQGVTSTMTGMLISNGRVIIADSGAMEALACFDANGVMSHANNPSVKYPVTLDGKQNGSLVSINKKYAYIQGKSSTASKTDEFFYYDRYCRSSIATSTISGYEVLCQKLDNTEIAIGRTLKGKVISVTESTFGKTVPESDDQFVLFVKSDSKYATDVSSLKEGSTVEIGAEAQGYVTQLESAYSAISSAYWLVKDGVDQTNTQSTIIHSVTLERAWTAFGVKADGTFVYFVNEEMGLSLKDVAGAMIQMGCTNVIRVDGGGSSAVYNEKDGIVYLAELPEYGGRQVCDTLLIVKKTSLTDAELQTQLEDALSVAKSLEINDPDLNLAIAYAEKVLESETPAMGDLKKAISALDLKGVLENAIADGEKADSSHYAQEDYSALETALNNAKTLLEKENPEATEYKEAISNLSKALALSKYQTLSMGSAYEVTEGKNYSYWADTKLFHDDGIRLTDGLKSDGNVLTKVYSAWKKDGDTVSVIIDLGESKQSNSYTVYTANGFWGVANCADFKIEGSNDKENFREIGTSQTVTDLGNGELIENTDQSTLHALTLKSDYIYDYRYIKFTMTINGNFLWVDELEVACDGTLAMKTPEPDDTSAPEDNSSEEPVNSESESQTEQNQTSVEENSSQNEEDGGNTVIIISVVVGVIVGAIVVFLIAKKKKK